jgi:hypothetical protein
MSRAEARRSDAPRIEHDASRGLGARLMPQDGSSWVALASGALALMAGLLLIAGEFTTLFSVDVGGTTCEAAARDAEVSPTCSPTGGERHLYAFAVLGAFALLMAWGAAAGRSRPAGGALVVIALVVLGILLISDLPDARSQGVIGVRYDDAQASPAIGFYLQVAGGALALAAGVLRLSRE